MAHMKGWTITDFQPKVATLQVL